MRSMDSAAARGAYGLVEPAPCSFIGSDRQALRQAPVHNHSIRPVAVTVAQTIAAEIESDKSAAASEIQSRTPSSSR